MALSPSNKFQAVEHPETREWVIIALTAEQRDRNVEVPEVRVQDQIVSGIPPFPHQGDAQDWAQRLSYAYEAGRAAGRAGTL